MLHEANQPFDLGPTTQIAVWKLHGSLSWVWLKNPPQDQPPLNERNDLKGWFKECWDEIDSRDEPNETLWALKAEHLANLQAQLDRLPSDLNPRPFIMPPIWHKMPLSTALLRSLWNYEAWKALDAASTIIVIGYSLPAADLYTRALLRAGVGHQSPDGGMSHLIDPDPEVAGRFSTTVTKRLDYRRTRFTPSEVEHIISLSSA